MNPGPAPVRLGVVNIMPRADEYEAPLLVALERTGRKVEPVWIRLETHLYRSTDPGHLARHYQTLDQALAGPPLDGLILSGAPVEEIPYSQVRYWPELTVMLSRVGFDLPPMLGLCWGAMALAKHTGIEKETYGRKLFGVFATTNLAPQGPVMAGVAPVFPCPQSRHAGLIDREVERATAKGEVAPLARAPETGVTIFRTPDGRFTGHLGHPEYPTNRLAQEYFRDQGRKRTDVGFPAGYDPEHPVNTWSEAGVAFFSGWLDTLFLLPGGQQ